MDTSTGGTPVLTAITSKMLTVTRVHVAASYIGHSGGSAAVRETPSCTRFPALSGDGRVSASAISRLVSAAASAASRFSSSFCLRLAAALSMSAAAAALAASARDFASASASSRVSATGNAPASVSATLGRC